MSDSGNNKKNYYIVGAIIAVCIVLIIVASQFMPGFLNKGTQNTLVNSTNPNTLVNKTSSNSVILNKTSSNNINSTNPNTGVSKNIISQLYHTIINGREWNANWYTKPHTLLPRDFDPYDPQFQARGDANIVVNGNDTATMSGGAPRMYVYDPTLEKKWNNVEITIYAKRISEQSQVSSQGITLGARSGSHDDVKYPDICKDSVGYPNSAYNARLTFDGRADYVKEVLYHKADAVSNDGSGVSPISVAAFSNLSTPLDNKTGFHVMPRDTWIGFKFIVRNVDNGTSVNLQSWIDLTDGQNGGNWKKINEYTDKGGWKATYFYNKNNMTWPCSDISTDYVINHPMPYIFVRADAVNAIDYKNFSIREINPLP
jgi:hypothetical protein